MTDSFLETLYREMYPKIFAFARVRLQDEQLAQEIAQDVFVLAQEKLNDEQGLHPMIPPLEGEG